MLTCRRGHPRTPENIYIQKSRIPGKADQRVCRICKQASNRNNKTPRFDGLEDLYGPVPKRVSNREWIDEVIVDRAMSYKPTGRLPYRREIDAIVSRIRPHHEIARIAEACGVEDQTVCGWIAGREGIPVP